jgi:hypothetical protein
MENEKLEQLREQASQIYDEIAKIEGQNFLQKVKEVFDSGILKESKWIVERHNDGFLLYGNDKKFKKLTEILQNDYHCHCELAEGVKIFFDDWDIKIVFENQKIAITFINEHHLPLDISKLIQQRDEQKKKYEETETFLNKFLNSF